MAWTSADDEASRVADRIADEENRGIREPGKYRMEFMWNLPGGPYIWENNKGWVNVATGENYIKRLELDDSGSLLEPTGKTNPKSPTHKKEGKKDTGTQIGGTR